MATIDDLENIEGLPAKFITVKPVNRGEEVALALIITSLEEGATMIAFTEEESDQLWRLVQRMTWRVESMNEELRREQT